MKRDRISCKFACLDYRETWNNYESTKAISFFIRFRVGDACNARICGNIEEVVPRDLTSNEIPIVATYGGDFLSRSTLTINRH